MNEPKENQATSEADRVIARYGVRPSESMRDALRDMLARERESFRALAREQDQGQQGLHQREERER